MIAAIYVGVTQKLKLYCYFDNWETNFKESID